MYTNINDDDHHQEISKDDIENELKTIIGEVLMEDKVLCGNDIEKFVDLETINDKINQLEKLKRKAMKITDITIRYITKDLVATQKDVLATASSSLKDGTFFASLDDVWDKIEVTFDTVTVDLFNRNHHHALEYYNMTASEAAKPECIVAFNALRSPGSSSYQSTGSTTDGTTTRYPNIFGAFGLSMEKAHLMPNSPG